MKKSLIAGALVIAVVLSCVYFSFRRPDTGEVTAKLNYTLIRQLDSIFVLDQKYRTQLDSLQMVCKNDPEKLQSFYRIMFQTDSTNLILVKQILDKYGWPGPEVIGPNGATTLFLAIQHSDQATQEKYLPLMRTAVKEGKAERTELALLEDRILIGQGKKQIYGTQLIYDQKTNTHVLQPLENPDHVDERRRAIGLGPLADYLASFGVKWDLETYKEEQASRH